ncbi:hypothetical protein PsYK624_130540 [Phanerochaete sordida]|uniref:Uncharacterized protein n=1 Tax=Phanerochaete sordida TaxID=48140 RepID=A0A9P3GJV2_9APHY|nr:hypothetical protein PsYK624_130540 [Phanerochaete sordida]
MGKQAHYSAVCQGRPFRPQLLSSAHELTPFTRVSCYVLAEPLLWYPKVGPRGHFYIHINPNPPTQRGRTRHSASH